jgi:nicotinate dehydrogenase subunit B
VSPLPASLARLPDLDEWIRIDAADTVTAFTGKVELGQGLRAAIARIVAEELDVDLMRVEVVTADTGRAQDEGVTSGSLSIQESGLAIRQAAAEVRSHLLEVAAERFDVAASDLGVRDGTIFLGEQPLSTYWELFGGRLLGRTATGKPQPKPPARFQVVGKRRTRPDLVEIVTGSKLYVHDLTPPDLLHGRVVRPPSPSAALDELDESHGELDGVVTLVRDGSFVGVVAELEERAIDAADALRRASVWREQPTLPPLDELPAWLKRRGGQSFLIVDGVGVDAEVPPIETPAGAGVTVRAGYTRPYTMHGSIGPSAAVAVWTDGLLTVWSSTQGVFPLQRALAAVLRVDRESVRVVHVEGAGCYGHNGSDDVALDAALLARAVPGRPVRVAWSREDEHCWEPYGPAAVVELEASLDRAGAVLDWNHDVWSPSHTGRAAAAPDGVSALVAAWHLADPLPRFEPPPMAKLPHVGIHRNADPYYAFPRKRVVKHFVKDHSVRTSSLRSLGAFANVFAIESFMDELAETANVDPIAFRLGYLDDPRAREVLELAADGIAWGERSAGDGRGIGIAFARYKNSACYAAVAVELSVDDTTAEVELERVVIAADAGQVVDPSGLENQLEGGVVQALSWTLAERVAFDDTRITSVDWATYPILSFSRIPAVETLLIDRPNLPPLGAGEATQGPTPAAVANAIAAATGVRVRELPITPDRLRAAAAA